MINFKIGERRDGKTTELIERYKRNPGIFVVQSMFMKRELVDHKGVDNVTLYTYGIDSIRGHKWIYLDEFFIQDGIKYEDIINLDNHANIFVRGHIDDYSKIPKDFLRYMKKKYPEYML